MSLELRLGIVGVILALFSLAAFYLWPNKKWIGFLSLAAAALLAYGWLALEIRQTFGRDALMLCAFIALGLISIIAIVSRWKELVTPSHSITLPRLLLAAVCMVGIFMIAFYRGNAESADEADSWDPANLKRVSGKTFYNETIDLDGHAYEDCRFIHVSIVYNGGPFELAHSVITPPVRIITDSKAVEGVVGLLKGLDEIREDMEIVGPNLKPMENIEPARRPTPSISPSAPPSSSVSP